VQLGAINLKNSEGEDWTEMKIESIEIHQNFKVKSNAAYYDVAVIRLISAIQFNDKIRLTSYQSPLITLKCFND
jgi:hypothetical protein